ncbi:MAG: M56 family metallopeptidase [bacterium]
MDAWFDLFSAFAYDSLGFIINSLWLGLLITFLTWAIWRYSKIDTSTLGYLVWWSALVLVAVAPFVVAASVPGEIGSGLSPVTAAVSRPPLTVDLKPTSTVPSGDHPTTPPKTLALRPLRSPSLSQSGMPLVPVESLSPEVISPPEHVDVGRTLLGLVPISALGIWLCGVLILTGRILIGHSKLRAIKLSSAKLDTSAYRLFEARREQFSWRRFPDVRVSSEVDYPVAAGLGRPTILIPRKLVGLLYDSEMEAILLHELAHLERGDDWTRLLQKIVQALGFFNPAIHWISRQLDLQREIACDRHVVAHTGRPNEYAHCLTRLISLTTGARASLVPGVMTGRKQIFKRFEAILHGRRRFTGRFWRLRVGTVMVLLAATLTVAVQSVPVLAVPVDVLSYDDLSQAVQTLASKLTSESTSEIPAGEHDVTTEAAIAVEGSETTAVESGRDDPPVAASPSASAAASSPTAPSARPAPRMVNWNSRTLWTPLTGFVHGNAPDDPVTVVWTSDDGDAVVALQGEVKIGQDGCVDSISQNGLIAVIDLSGRVTKEVDIRPGDQDELTYTYYRDDRLADFGDRERKWLRRILSQTSIEVEVLGSTDRKQYYYAAGRSDAEKLGKAMRTYAPWIATANGQVNAAANAQANTAAKLSQYGHANFFLLDPDQSADDLTEATAGLLSAGDTYSDAYYQYVTSRDNEDDNDDGLGIIDGAVGFFGDLIGGISKGLWIRSDDHYLEVNWNEMGRKGQLRVTGDVTYSDDMRRVSSIRYDGSMTVWEKTRKSSRRLKIEAADNGKLNYVYKVDGEIVDFDHSAEKWLGDLLEDILRRSGINAEQRARHLHDQGGIDAVLEEMAEVDGDYVRRKYVDPLLKDDRLTDVDLDKLLRQLGELFESDYEKTELLVSIAGHIADRPQLVDGYVDVVETIDSDYEAHRALSVLALEHDVAGEVVAQILKTADRFDSDYERAELLIEISPLVARHPDLRDDYVEAVRGIESDYEKVRVLSALPYDKDAPDEQVRTALDIAGTVDSDYERAELLVNLARRTSDSKLQAAIIKATGEMNSAYEIARVLRYIDADCDSYQDNLLQIMRIMQRTAGDYEKAQMLKEYAACVKAAGTLRSQYFAMLRDLDSDYERGQSLQEILRSTDPDEALVKDLLDVVVTLSSDYDKAQVLSQMARYCRDDENLESLYFDVVDGMSSDYEINKLYRKMHRRSRSNDSSDW